MDFRYLVETKNEFNNFLSDILVPHIYNGIKGMFKYSENVYSQLEERRKKGSNINNPGVINIFKKTLDGISGLNNHEIEEEYIRIKNNSGCVEWFDLLVKASFKSYVLYLTWDPKTAQSKYNDNSLYNNIIIKDFIHKCYIVACSHFKENPELFLNRAVNKKNIHEIIKKCLEISMRNCLPYNNIIQEYLLIDFTSKDRNTEEISNIKNLVYNMINNNKYGEKPTIKKVFMDESDDTHKLRYYKSNNDNNLDLKANKQNEIEDFINLEMINKKNNNLLQEEQIPVYQNNIDLTNSSGVLTRSTVKSKEVDAIINNTQENHISETTSEYNEDDEYENEDDENEVNKESEENKIKIIESPPIIKNKMIDRFEDLGIKKRNVQVVLNKTNNRSDEFDQYEKYFDGLINK